MRIAVVLALVASGFSLVAHAASLPASAFPNLLSAADVKAACDRGLTGAKQRLKALEQRAPDAGWLAASDDLNAHAEDAYYPIGLLTNVHPDKALRDAAQACELRWQDFFSSLGLNRTLYRAAKRVQPRDAVDREARRLTLEGFEDAGVGLAPAKRNEAKRLADRIAALGLRFDANVRDDNTKVGFTEAELKGVPRTVWESAKRDDAGRYLLGLDMPTYQPVVQTADEPATRERMWRAKISEGGDANLALLGEIAQLRRAYAKLFGFASYADFALRRRMVKTMARADAFLNEVKTAVTAGEARELSELRAAKAQHLNQPVERTVLERWDVAFYTERVRRERYAVDQEAFRRHFSPQESLQFVMTLAERLFGVHYERVDATLWHPEVQAYVARDVATGKALAHLFVDLYPREGKYNHAAVWPVRNSAARVGRLPQAALIVNFDRKGLTLEELETLLHEFGHALHNNLSVTRYTLQGGTSTVHDFAEAPSQMLEDWVYDKDVLKLFAEVCARCTPVPDAMLAQAKVAKDYAKGVLWARQHLQAAYDLALYGPDATDPMTLWQRMEAATPLGHVHGTKFPAGFTHIATGYAAGYYGYLWSLVVAMDLRTAFDANRLDAAVGRRYRNTILAHGGERPAEELVREFLGRDSNSNAFFEYLSR